MSKSELISIEVFSRDDQFQISQFKESDLRLIFSKEYYILRLQETFSGLFKRSNSDINFRIEQISNITKTKYKIPSIDIDKEMNILKASLSALELEYSLGCSPVFVPEPETSQEGFLIIKNTSEVVDLLKPVLSRYLSSLNYIGEYASLFSELSNLDARLTVSRSHYENDKNALESLHEDDKETVLELTKKLKLSQASFEKKTSQMNKLLLRLENTLSAHPCEFTSSTTFPSHHSYMQQVLLTVNSRQEFDFKSINLWVNRERKFKMLHNVAVGILLIAGVSALFTIHNISKEKELAQFKSELDENLLVKSFFNKGQYSELMNSNSIKEMKILLKRFNFSINKKAVSEKLNFLFRDSSYYRHEYINKNNTLKVHLSKETLNYFNNTFGRNARIYFTNDSEEGIQNVKVNKNRTEAKISDICKTRGDLFVGIHIPFPMRKTFSIRAPAGVSKIRDRLKTSGSCESR